MSPLETEVRKSTVAGTDRIGLAVKQTPESRVGGQEQGPN